jgi:hypothetical protein
VTTIRSELEHDIVATQQEKAAVEDRLIASKKLIATANANASELERLTRVYALE